MGGHGSTVALWILPLHEPPLARLSYKSLGPGQQRTRPVRRALGAGAGVPVVG